MAAFQKLQKMIEAADLALRKAIDKEYPVGSKVVVFDGAGREMFCTVCHDCAEGGYLCVRSRFGHVHRKHWTQLREATRGEALCFYEF